jgi:hypothetical protein
MDDIVWVPAYDASSCGSREAQLGFSNGDVDDSILFKPGRMGVEDLGEEPDSAEPENGWHDLTPSLFSPSDRASSDMQLQSANQGEILVVPQQPHLGPLRGGRNLPHLTRHDSGDSDIPEVLSTDMLSPNSLGYSFDRGRNGTQLSSRHDGDDSEVSLPPPVETEGQGLTYVFIDPITGEYREVCPAVDAASGKGVVPGDAYDNGFYINNNNNGKIFSTTTPRADKQFSPRATTIPSPPRLSPSPAPSEVPICRACVWGKHESHICGKGRGLSVSGTKRPQPIHQASDMKPEDAPTPKKPAHASSKPKKDDPDWVAPGRSSGSNHKYSAAAGAKAEKLQALKEGVESGAVKIKIKEPKPVNKCTYECCPNPYHTSGGWKLVSAETKAGGRDWRPYIGRLFCNACFTQVGW